MMKSFSNNVTDALSEIGARNINYRLDHKIHNWAFDFIYKNVVWPLEVRTIVDDLSSLPNIFWRVESPVWGWPHVASDGDICISDREGLEYDTEDYVGVLGWLVTEAVHLMDYYSAKSDGDRLTEFADEIEGYFNQLGCARVGFDEELDQNRQLYCESQYRPLPKTWKSKPVAFRLNHGTTAVSNIQQHRINTIKVTISQLPKPNFKDSRWNSAWWEEFQSRLNCWQRKLSDDKKARGLLLNIANQYGGGLILLHWGTENRNCGWMYIVGRQNRKYVLNRTGTDTLNRHVVVIGCGAIGSRVAEHLALAGIEKITLVDNDKFSADNLARHVLGRRSIGHFKVDALADYLVDRVPGINVESIRSRSDQLTLGVFRDSNAIILATGKPALERSIVRTAYKEYWKPLIISVSVEACGLGGHSIASQPGEKGCLECLYIDPDTGQKKQKFRGSFVVDGETVTRQLTGCGAFTPYSAIDATKTALLAVEQALGHKPGYARWIGCSEKALESNITPSHVHETARSSDTSLFLPEVYAHEGCSCCND